MNIIFSIILSSHLVGVDPKLMLGLCHTETNWRNVHNMQDGGSPSYGICQVKHRTAKWFFPSIMSENLKNVLVNSFVAAAYLKYQIDRYKSVRKGISAYNGGRYIKFNKKYVNKVLSKQNEIQLTFK